MSSHAGKIDIQINFREGGRARVDMARGDIATVDGVANLVQAIYLRLLTKKGDMAHLGHPDYGSRIHELIGYSLNRANLELLRRYVRQALSEEPRVAHIEQVGVTPLPHEPGVVEIDAVVTSAADERLEIGIQIDVG